MSVREQLGRVIQFWRCKDKHKKIGLVRICPYLSDFVKKNCKFLIFSTFNPLKILVFLAKLPKIHYLCNVTKQLREWRQRRHIWEVTYTNQPTLHITRMIIKTYQKSHLAHLFSPNLSQESANRRLRRWINGDQKLCEELRKVGFFDHQRDHFFTKKEVELLFEYIGEPCKWLNINILNNSKVSRCQSVKVSNSFRAAKIPANK